MWETSRNLQFTLIKFPLLFGELAAQESWGMEYHLLSLCKFQLYVKKNNKQINVQGSMSSDENRVR